MEPGFYTVQKKLIRAIDMTWKTNVAKDYEENRLWNGQVCISTVLSFHLRTSFLAENNRVKMWFEALFPEVWGSKSKKHVDVVFDMVDPKIRGRTYDYYRQIPKKHLVAMEMKYAVSYVEGDIQRLNDIGKGIPSIVPIFAYVSSTSGKEKPSPTRETVMKEVKKAGIGLLYGDGNDSDKWESFNLDSYM